MRLDVKGCPTFVAAAGPAPSGADQVVVLVHGAGMAGTVWAAQLTALAGPDRAVLAPTLAGHGQPGSSQASAGEPAASIAGWAAWLLALLDAVAVPQAVLVGHSMGALIALETAATAPERVVGVALLGAGRTMRVHPALLAEAGRDPASAAERILEWGFAPPQGDRPPGLSLVNVGRRLLVASAPGVLAQDLAACNAWEGGAIAKVTCPALVVIGGRDRMTPPQAGRALAADLPRAVVEELPQSGHMMLVEQPRPVTLALGRWLDRLSGAAGSAACPRDRRAGP